jgi:hypothetical protein
MGCVVAVQLFSSQSTNAPLLSSRFITCLPIRKLFHNNRTDKSAPEGFWVTYKSP